jgi:hypothetical protein
MTTEAFPTPTTSYRTHRTALVAVLALVIGALIGAGFVALIRTDEPARTAPAQRAAILPTVNVACPGDGGALLATMASMPIDVSSDIMSRLSDPTRALLSSAVEQSVISRSMPEAPDTTTLSAALLRVGATDAALLTSGLSSQTREAIAAAAAASACP